MANPTDVQNQINAIPWTNNRGLVTGDELRSILIGIVGLFGGGANLRALHGALYAALSSLSPPLSFQSFLANYVTEPGNPDGTYAAVFLDISPVINGQFYIMLHAFLVAQGLTSGAADALLVLAWTAAGGPSGAANAFNPATLPTTLPALPGVLWNNGGVVSIS
jgi:hypothetical protein